jgi:futalosine hydrolase
MGLRSADESPYEKNKLKAIIPDSVLSKLPFEGVDALTVNRVLGNQSTIDKTLQHFDVSIESMEGAAVYYVSRMYHLNCLQLRAVSNYVENRDRSSWKIEEALANLAEGTLKFLENVEA